MLKCIVLDHISSLTPVLQPVRKLVEVCHRHGVISVIDGAHAPGQIPLNLPEIDADFYAGMQSCFIIWHKKNLFICLISIAKYLIYSF